MDVKVYPGKLHGTIKAVPSKSQAHRALICAALADGETQVLFSGGSEDITATTQCLRALGATISEGSEGCAVSPIIREADKNVAHLPCNESGSTFRFLLPIVCALGRNASFIQKGRLHERPISPLYEELIVHGCILPPKGSNPFNVSGGLTPGSYSLDAGVSSQFISGLLFALPLLGGSSELRMVGRAESFSFIGLTTAMLDLFGIVTEFDGEVFYIPGGQAYQSPKVVEVEGDWSNAAFWLGAGAIGEKSLVCTGLDMRSRQGDRAIVELLSRFGARIETSGTAVSVSGGKLQGIEIDASDIPDLVPILAVVACFAQGVTAIRNAGRLRSKESDRLAAISSVLCGLGANVSENEDGLTITGGAALGGGKASSWEDHRIVMAASVAATFCQGPVEILGAQSVNKSYPNFFDDFQTLGGNIVL